MNKMLYKLYNSNTKCHHYLEIGSECFKHDNPLPPPKRRGSRASGKRDCKREKCLAKVKQNARTREENNIERKRIPVYRNNVRMTLRQEWKSLTDNL